MSMDATTHQFPQAQPEAATQGQASALEAREISAWFGEHHVLDRVSLLMQARQVTALIGPSGCGKSTFLRILNRMHELTPSASLAGDVLLDGSDIITRRHIVNHQVDCRFAADKKPTVNRGISLLHAMNDSDHRS